MSSILKKFGTLFYVVDYNATTFQRKEDVPNYLNEAVPLFLCMVILEWLICHLTGGEKHKFRTGDALTSAGHGIVYETSKIFTRGAELFCYDWLYEYRLFDLDWSSPVTWVIAAIGVDLGFYCYHRATHEINLGWAAHQVHHSSEDLNLTTALRQSLFQRCITVFFYNPLALIGVPLPAVLVHIQLNLLYQFWLHTELVKKLGPLEWIFNTPSHHRVHHGVNKWCLDKNYAGFLIIWDRLFGTFQAEKEGESIVYGVVKQPHSFNVLWLQVYYYGTVARKAFSMRNWRDFLKAIFCGPGWSPSPACSNDVKGAQDITTPEMKYDPKMADVVNGAQDVTTPRVKYDPKIPLLHELYVVVHFFTAIAVQQMLIAHYATFSWYSALYLMAFVFASMSIVGAIYDGRWWASSLESARCASYVAYSLAVPVFAKPAIDCLFTFYFAASSIFWGFHSVKILKTFVRKKV